MECSRASILKSYKNDPEFSIRLSALFARQLQRTRKRLELLSIRNAEERVMSALLEGLLIDDEKFFAADISLSAEATYRALGKLSKDASTSTASCVSPWAYPVRSEQCPIHYRFFHVPSPVVTVVANNTGQQRHEGA